MLKINTFKKAMVLIEASTTVMLYTLQNYGFTHSETKDKRYEGQNTLN